jgi:hypothetical protein
MSNLIRLNGKNDISYDVKPQDFKLFLISFNN